VEIAALNRICCCYCYCYCCYCYYYALLRIFNFQV